MRSVTLVLLASLVLLLLPGIAIAPSNVHVHIQGSNFVPGSVTATFGDTITWNNHDGITHTASHDGCRAGDPDPCLWDSGNLALGQSFTATVPAVGDLYTYLCLIHGFTGTLFVDDPLRFADLVVTELVVVKHNPNPFSVSSTRGIRFSVTNAGDEISFATQATVSYFIGEEERPLRTENLPILRPGEFRSFTVRWDDLYLIGDVVIQAVADSAGTMVESDEANTVQIVESIVTPPGFMPGMDVRDLA